MIVSQTIHAGDTPLACTLTVEQTGPMQLTVRAGSFTTTGEARILTATDIQQMRLDPAALIAAGKAEWLPDGARLRVWLQDQSGAPVLKSATYTLAADVVLNLTSDPTSAKRYLLDFGTLAGVPDVLCRSQFDGEALPAEPAGWQAIHWLVDGFVVPAQTTSLDAVLLRAFAVVPGFPVVDGVQTTGADWAEQRGTVSCR